LHFHFLASVLLIVGMTFRRFFQAGFGRRFVYVLLIIFLFLEKDSSGLVHILVLRVVFITLVCALVQCKWGNAFLIVSLVTLILKLRLGPEADLSAVDVHAPATGCATTTPCTLWAKAQHEHQPQQEHRSKYQYDKIL